MRKIDITWIIDDDPIFIFGLRKKLNQSNICKEVVINEDGKQALDRLKLLLTGNKSQLPDLILLDLNMPQIDGWQFLKYYEEIPLFKKIIIFMLTSSINPADEKKAKSYKLLDGFYVKPIKDPQLQEIKAHYDLKKDNIFS